MAETRPFKEFLDAAAVGRLASMLAAARPGWDPARFEASAASGLDALELKARVGHVARAVRDHLDPDYTVAVQHVVDALPPPHEGTEGVAEAFELWPLCTFVEHYGVDHLEPSLEAMHALTQRFSCEFAIRPYLRRYENVVLERLARWSRDPSPHVRRLVSEGSRPRLPWGGQLKGFIADPSPTLPLLEALKDDPEEYVRRSVANHLNDIAKDHPDVVVEVAGRWLQGADRNRRRLVEHGLRTLVKKGNSDALALLGYGPPSVELRSLTLSESRPAVGSSIEVTIVLTSTSEEEQSLLLDYAVHHQRANGTLSPKVFKWTKRTLAAGKTLTLTKKHSLRKVTTRRYYAGEHAVEVLCNGQSLGRVRFDLTV